MSVIGRLSVLVTLAIVCGAPVSWSQDGRDELKRTVERRFDVLPLREGVALRPKAPIAGIRSIEISGGMIGIDGQPATGAELRSKLGADADACGWPCCVCSWRWLCCSDASTWIERHR